MIRLLNIQFLIRNMPRASVVILFVLLSFPFQAYSLGLGGIKLNSSLDQKLNASIEILSATDEEINALEIKLAPAAVYERMGIERTVQLEQLKFNVVKSADGDDLIVVTTPLTVTEPFLNFLIEVNWASGRLLREFTILLDPPVFLDEEGGASVSTPETGLPPVLTTPAGTTEVAGKLATDDNIQTTEPSNDTEQDSIVDEEISNILSGEERAAEIVIEDTDETPSLADESVKTSTSLVYEKVKQNEILWRIADRMRPQDISVEQMMLALQRENPNAFFGNTVSMLKAGAILRIENTDTLDDISTSDAVAEIAKQHQEWLAYRKERQARNAVAAESANLTPVGERDAQASAGEVPVALNETNQPLLELVAPTSEETASKSESSNAALEAAEEKVNELNIELVMANEELEARKRENEDLVTRLNSLEEQMSAMQSLVQLKDAELAKLRSGSITPEENTAFSPMEIAIPEEDSSNATVTRVVTKSHEVNPKQLWQDPVTIGTAIFALLLIALSIVLIRRKSKVNETDEDELDHQHEKSLDELFPEDNQTTTPIRASDSSEIFELDSEMPLVQDSDSDVSIDTLGPMTSIDIDEPRFDEPRFDESEVSVLDPLSEADVYMTYERFDKAEELLKEAIQVSPDRQELKLKLLEVYSAADNKEKFNLQAEELYAALSGDESNALWQQAIILAHTLDVDSPLFSSMSEDVSPSKTLTEYDSLRGSDQTDTVDAPHEETLLEESDPSTKDKELSISETFEAWEPDQVTEFSAQDSQDEDILDTKIDSFESDDNGDIFDPSVLDELEESDVSPIEETTLVAEYDTQQLDSDDVVKLSAIDKNNTPEKEKDLPATENALDETLEHSKEKVIDKVDEFKESDLDPVTSIQAEIEGTTELTEADDRPEIDKSIEDKIDVKPSKHLEQSSDDEHDAVEPPSKTGITDEDLEKALSAFTDDPMESSKDAIIDRDMEEDISVSDVFDDIPSGSESLFDEAGDTSFFLLSDEVGTKLDLARAYIEMGDHEGASDLLQEVMNEGDKKQRREANELMNLTVV